MADQLDLQLATHHCRLLADSTRLRLLLLLDREELSVAELSAITQLAQPRVSTHLAKLKEAGLVIDRRQGVSVYYRMANKVPVKTKRKPKEKRMVPIVIKNRNGRYNTKMRSIVTMDFFTYDMMLFTNFEGRSSTCTRIGTEMIFMFF